eukprot:2248532-Amphidinium_carterae.2
MKFVTLKQPNSFNNEICYFEATESPAKEWSCRHSSHLDRMAAKHILGFRHTKEVNVICKVAVSFDTCTISMARKAAIGLGTAH